MNRLASEFEVLTKLYCKNFYSLACPDSPRWYYPKREVLAHRHFGDLTIIFYLLCHTLLHLSLYYSIIDKIIKYDIY